MLMILTFVSGIHLYQIAMRREYALKERSLLAEDQCVMVIVLEFLDLETIFPNDTLSDEDMNETHSFLLLSVKGAWT